MHLIELKLKPIRNEGSRSGDFNLPGILIKFTFSLFFRRPQHRQLQPLLYPVSYILMFVLVFVQSITFSINIWSSGSTYILKKCTSCCFRLYLVRITTISPKLSAEILIVHKFSPVFAPNDGICENGKNGKLSPSLFKWRKSFAAWHGTKLRQLSPFGISYDSQSYSNRNIKFLTSRR